VAVLVYNILLCSSVLCGMVFINEHMQRIPSSEMNVVDHNM